MYIQHAIICLSACLQFIKMVSVASYSLFLLCSFCQIIWLSSEIKRWAPFFHLDNVLRLIIRTVENRAIEKGQNVSVDGVRHFCVDLQSSLCFNWLQFFPPRGKTAFLEANSRRKQFLSKTNKQTISYPLMCNKGLPKPTRLLDSNVLCTSCTKISSFQTRDVALNLCTMICVHVRITYLFHTLDLVLMVHMPRCPEVTGSWLLTNSQGVD